MPAYPRLPQEPHRAKSNLQFDHLHHVSEHQLRVVLTARLAVVVLYYHALYQAGAPRLSHDYARTLSLLKLIRFLTHNPELLSELLRALRDPPEAQGPLALLAPYCTYERRPRSNFAERQEQLFAVGALS